MDLKDKEEKMKEGSVIAERIKPLDVGKLADVCIFEYGGHTIKETFLIVSRHLKNLRDYFYSTGIENESFQYQKGLSNIAYLQKNSTLYKFIENLKEGEVKRYKNSNVFVALDKIKNLQCN